jgi:hypothetical protein
MRTAIACWHLLTKYLMLLVACLLLNIKLLHLLS